MKQYKIAAIEFARIRAYTLMAIFNPCGFTLFRVEKFNERRQRAHKKCETKQKREKKRTPKTIYQKDSVLNERKKKYTRKKVPQPLKCWMVLHK